MGVTSGIGCKEVYRFPPTPLAFVLFCSSIPTFCSFYIRSLHCNRRAFSPGIYNYNKYKIMRVREHSSPT